MVDCGVPQRCRPDRSLGIHVLLVSALFAAQGADAAMPNRCAGDSAVLLSRILGSAAPPSASATESMARGLDAFVAGDSELAASHWSGAAARYETQGDDTGRAEALYRLSRAYDALGLRPEERAALEQALPLARGASGADGAKRSELIAAILSALEHNRSETEQLQQFLQQEDWQGLEQFLSEAKDGRDQWFDQYGKERGY